jgi:hypothetical protein
MCAVAITYMHFKRERERGCGDVCAVAITYMHFKREPASFRR